VNSFKGAVVTTLTADSSHLNPYAAPATVADTPLELAVPLRTRWLRRLIVLQAFVIPISLAVEAYVHESIVGSGLVFSGVGLTIAITAFRHRDHVAALFGGSAIAFALLIVFLINYNAWGPPQGNQPITILSFMYAAWALPMSVWLVIAKHHRLVNEANATPSARS
jgi:hypothetical protein